MEVFILRLHGAILVFPAMVNASVVYEVFPKSSPICREAHKGFDDINSFVHFSLESVLLVIANHEYFIVAYVSCS